MNFEWNDEKNKANIKKHGLPLQAGAAVFYDDYRIEEYEGSCNYGEDRFITIGMHKNSRILYVVYTMRNNDGVIRIISVRKAENSEQKLYERNLG